MPGLYTHEELEPLLAPLKEQMGDGGFAFRTPYDFFVSRIRANTHVVIGMDPLHPDFLARCERNPALYTRCALQWLGAWRKQSLVDVANALLAESFASTSIFVPNDALVDVAVGIHVSQGPRGAAPRDFISLLKAYQGIYQVRADRACHARPQRAAPFASPTPAAPARSPRRAAATRRWSACEPA